METLTLNHAFQPLLNQIVTLEAFNEQSKEQAMHQLQHAVSQVKERAKAKGCPNSEVQEASYALAALIDEQIPLRCPKLAGKWRSALLQELFQDNQGGTYFFDRLETLLKSPERNEALGIYAICLAYGFRGKFSDQGRDELVRLRQQLRRRLPSAKPGIDLGATRSPATLCPSHRLNAKTLLWPSAIALFLTVIALTTFRSRLEKTSESLLRALPTVLDPSRVS